MQEKVEKYIYYISENKFRVKFLKIDKKSNKKISFDEYLNGSLEDAIKLRNEKLKENGISLYKEKKSEDIFDDASLTEKKKDTKLKKERKSAINQATNKVDKYIYEVEKGKKYRIFIRKGGSNGQKGDYYSAVFEGTLAQARRERDRKLAELKLKNGKGDKGSIRFVEFAKIYFKEYAEKELSPTTVEGGKRTLKNYVLPEIANMPLNKIDALTIQRIINNLKERDKEKLDKDGNTCKLSPSSVNNVYRILRKVLNKAVAWDYLETNPVLKVKAPGVSKKEKESYNRNELIEILDILKQEDLITETLFTISICTGVRRGELVGLHIDDIDFENNMISIKRAVIWDKQNHRILEKETKTKGSVREVPIPLFCTETIKEYLKLRDRLIMNFKRKNKNYNPPKNLFLNKTGGILFPDTPSSKWLSFRTKHPEVKNVSLHGLRHSYCSMQMNENPNLSPADVRKLMGHSQLSTTFIYTHSNDDKTDAAISVFEKYYITNGERQVNFREILSLYTGLNFTTTNIIKELLDYVVKGDVEEDIKYKLIKEYIDKKYPIFKKINISDVNIDNIWDWLETKTKQYGNEFILCPINNNLN